MRVAACISGRIRTLRYVFPGMIEHVLKPLNADVFVYAKGCTTQDVKLVTDIWPRVEIKVGEDLIHDQTILIECKKRAYRSKGSVKNLLGQCQSVKECNTMRNEYEVAHGFKYDLVVRMRTDLKFYESVQPPEFYDPSLLYVPDWGGHGGTNDRFAISGPDIMDEYAMWGDEVVDNILQGRTRFHAERTLQAHIAIHGITTAKADIRFGICRTRKRVQLYGMPPLPPPSAPPQ